MHETHKLALRRQLETAERAETNAQWAETNARKIEELSELLLSLNNKHTSTNTHQHMHHALNTETINSGHHGINQFIDV